MAPAPTHTDHMLTAAANQDKGPDGERHRADTIDSVIHVRDVSPTLSTLDAPSTDRFEDSTAAVFTSAAAASTTTSGSLSNCIQVNASYDPTNNSERGNDKSAEITGGSAVTCWCQLGHVCDRCCLNSMARAQPDPRELTELGSCHTGCTRGQPGTDITLARAPTNQTTDAMLPQKSDCELENTEAHGYLSVMERRQHKRKLGQSALFPLDVISVDISKQARVEENYSSNNLATEDRLMLTQGRLILMGDTVDTNVLSGESGTYHLHVDRRELGNERQAECLVASAVLDTSPVCEGKHRASGMAGGSSLQLETLSDLRVSVEPDLWARMEGLYKTTPGKRASISTSAARRRPVAEKFHSRYQPRHLADNLAGNGCHHSNKRTRSQISRRASSKTRAISIWTRSSRSWQIVDWCPAHHRYRVRSNSSSGGSSRSRSHSPVDSNRGQSCDSDYIDGNWSSQEPCRYKQEARSLWRWRCCRSRASLTSRRPRSPLPHKQVKNHHPDGLDIIKQLFAPLVLPSSVTTVIAAPVTGTTSTGQGNGGSGAINNPSVGNSIDNKHPSTATLSSPEKAKKVNGGQNLFAPNMGDKNKSESRGNNESSFEANTMSLPPRPQNLANSRVGNARMDAGNSEHYMGPPARSANHFGDHPDHNMQREEQRYEPHFNNMGYHPGMDHSFHEDAGYEFYGADYDYLYDERNDEYGFGNEPYPPHLHQRHPGPNTYYPRRPPPQGPRGPPQMFAPNDRGYGPPRPNMGGPSSRMGPNGPVGSRGPRSPMGPRGHRPQGGPGGPLGPPVMRGPPRGSPYGPPRGSPYGPPGPMRPQGMRGPPGPGMMGQAGHGGPAGPRPRLGPPARMQSPMPRQGSQPPGGPRPRMGPPPPRDDQYLPQRPAVVPPNTGDPSFCNPLPNFSQPPPNFVPSTSSLPPSTATAASAAQIADVVAPPPPLPPPKPPTPKPPPPPKKEEEKKEEIKPMTPLIPPEQAEQYRKLREQARKHARKQQRKQEHQAKGEPESSDDDDEEATAKKKEYEAKLSAEREEMEKAALLAVEDNGALHFEEGATILMPATQQTLMQQPTMMVQHHPLATQPSSYGLMPASHLLHAAHPGLHPSQLQNLQFMTSAGQPQLVQLPNGQMAYAMAAPMSYQTGAQMIAMPHQATMSAGAMPHHVLFSPGGMHQVPVTAHSGLTVSGSQYMAHVMASQVQAAQIQAAQAAQIQAAQAAQVQAAQAAQVQAVQAAQIQAAQVAQVQAVQAAQAQAVQAAQAQAAQVQSGMSGMVPGMHMAQHVLPAMHPQGQYILVPRVARPQM